MTKYVRGMFLEDYYIGLHIYEQRFTQTLRYRYYFCLLN